MRTRLRTHAHARVRTRKANTSMYVDACVRARTPARLHARTCAHKRTGYRGASLKAAEAGDDEARHVGAVEAVHVGRQLGRTDEDLERGLQRFRERIVLWRHWSARTHARSDSGTYPPAEASGPTTKEGRLLDLENLGHVVRADRDLVLGLFHCGDSASVMGASAGCGDPHGAVLRKTGRDTAGCTSSPS